MVDSLESRRRAVSLIEGLGCTTLLRVVEIPGKPVAKGRPRFTRSGHAYTPAETIEGERRIAERLKRIPRYRANVGIACLFYLASRQRIDVDNLVKAVLDGGNQAKIWDDDSQVTALVGVVELDRERPRTVVCLGEHTSSLVRGAAVKGPQRRRKKGGGS